MTNPIALDAGPLGRISHPRPNREMMDWLRSHLEHATGVFLPEIAYYEVRRELLRAEKRQGLARLAQAESVGAVIATDKVGHLAQFVSAKPWHELIAS